LVLKEGKILGAEEGTQTPASWNLLKSNHLDP